MNYDQARERMDKDGKPSSLFDWTTMNDGHVRAAGPCMTHTCEHHSAEEAEKHFYDYCLDQVKEFHLGDQQLRCEVCGEFTDGGLGNQSFYMLSFHSVLCPTHRNKERLKALHPFHTGIALYHS